MLSMDYSLTLAALLGVFMLLYTLRRKSALRNIPGPLPPSWIYGLLLFPDGLDAYSTFTGNMLELMFPPMYGENEFAWQKMYGTVYRVKGCFGVSQHLSH
jgi:hypothetical protein